MSLKSDAIFDKIATRITKIDPANRQVTNIYKFKITVNDAVVKTWILDLKNVKLFAGEGDADCTLTISDDNMFAMGSGQITAKDAVAQDKLDIDGDLAMALLLEPFVSTL